MNEIMTMMELMARQPQELAPFHKAARAAYFGDYSEIPLDAAQIRLARCKTKRCAMLQGHRRTHDEER